MGRCSRAFAGWPRNAPAGPAGMSPWSGLNIKAPVAIVDAPHGPDASSGAAEVHYQTSRRVEGRGNVIGLLTDTPGLLEHGHLLVARTAGSAFLGIMRLGRSSRGVHS
jgi:hypothetical protein